MCKRDTTDPLVRLLLDKYKLHLLLYPREDATVGDVYQHYDGATYAPGRYDALLAPPFKFPQLHAGEKVADISGTASNAVSAKVGLGLLENFLAAIGSVGWIEKLNLSIDGKGAKNLKFHFARPTRDYVDPLQLELALRDHKLDPKKSLFDAKRRYFITTAVMRSNALSITAQDDNAKSLNVEIEALRAVSADAGVKMEKDAQNEITFSGRKSLAFGIELHELRYDPSKRRNQLGLMGTSEAIRVRARANAGDELAPTSASFIGDPKTGDIFLEVRGEG